MQAGANAPNMVSGSVSHSLTGASVIALLNSSIAISGTYNLPVSMWNGLVPAIVRRTCKVFELICKCVLTRVVVLCFLS